MPIDVGIVQMLDCRGAGATGAVVTNTVTAAQHERGVLVVKGLLDVGDRMS
jgi:hypothetical protein